MINGKVVDESSEVEQIEERKKWANVIRDKSSNVLLIQNARLCGQCPKLVKNIF